MFKEQRIYKRIQIRIPVQLSLSGGKRLTVTSANLSAGGIAVSYKAPADKGARFGVSFTVSSDGESRDIGATGEVVHHYLSATADLYVIGMSFVGISDEERELVDHYVHSIDRMRGAI